MKKNISHKILSLALSFIMVFSIIGIIPSVNVSASETKTAIGLAEFGLRAYNEDWKYNYGSYGQLTSDGKRQFDCSGLIYAYLCWTGETTNPSPNYSMPRTVTAQAKASSVSGDISTLPRTHGLILTTYNYNHVGIYIGNDKSVDASDYGVDMRMLTVSQYDDWLMWHKLDSVEYPTTGWYTFNNKPFYYENGEYVINTSIVIDGTSYTFDNSGTPSPLPAGYTEGDFADSSESTPNVEDNTSISAVTTANVNLRSGMSTGTSVIKVVPNGTALTITNKDNSSWYKVTLADGTVGFMSASYIKETSASTDSGANTTLNISAAATAHVNLRESATTSSAVKTVVATGTALTIIEKTNSSWYQVKLADGTTGYIYAQYIKEVVADSNSSESTATGTLSISAKTTTAVNLRQGQGTNTSVVKVVGNNTDLTITDKSNAAWYQVKLADGTVGYMSSQYITEVTSGSEDQTTAPVVSSNATTTVAVNLRQGQGTNTAVIKVVASNTSLEVINTDNAQWYQVKLADGTTGYMSSQYVSLASNNNAGGETMTATTYVNVRTGPGLDYSVVTVLATDAKVSVTDKSNSEWFQVVTGAGQSGYMSSAYLK